MQDKPENEEIEKTTAVPEEELRRQEAEAKVAEMFAAAKTVSKRDKKKKSPSDEEISALEFPEDGYGYEENDDIDVEGQLQLTINNLQKLGVVTDHQLISNNSLIINPGYVHITKESNTKVAWFKDVLKKNDAYTIGRYGGWTYCSIEDCMIEAMKLSAQLNPNALNKTL